MPKIQPTFLTIVLIAGSLCLLTACDRSGVYLIEDMKTGECYNKIKVYNEGEIVPCDTPHDAEVVAANAKGVSRQGSDITVGVGHDARLADCLGVPVEEVDSIIAERGLKTYYHGNFDAYMAESKSGKLTEAICR